MRSRAFCKTKNISLKDHLTSEVTYFDHLLLEKLAEAHYLLFIYLLYCLRQYILYIYVLKR